MLLAVFGVMMGTSFAIMIGFVAWRYRYYYLKNRFRAYFTNQSDHTFSKVLKLSPGAENFTVKGLPGQYKIMQDRITTTGGYRMPSSYYRVGEDTPKDMQQTTEGSVSSTRFREVATNRVMSDLFTSFKRTVIDNATALVITVVVILIATLGLGAFLNGKLTEINERLPSVAPIFETPESASFR